MKTLIGFRHSLKDKDNNISPEGVLRAERQGIACQDLEFSKMWRGVLPRTTQTLKAFLFGYTRRGATSMVQLMDEMPAFGSDAMFAEMVDDRFKAAVKDGKSNFDALLATRTAKEIEDKWALPMFAALVEMFGQLQDGETGAFFGHSPTTELAAAAVGDELADLAPEYRTLTEMAGIIFVMNGDDIRIVGPVPIPEEPAKS